MDADLGVEQLKLCVNCELKFQGNRKVENIKKFNEIPW